MAASDEGDEDRLLRSVALQNAQSVLSARQRAEEALLAATEALRESNQRATNILESITDGFIAVDGEWRLTYVNAKALEILRPLHKTAATLLGANSWSEFPELVGTHLEDEYIRAMKERITAEFEFFYTPLKSWFDIRIYPAKNGLSVYFQDITKRKVAEHELKRQREWFRVTLASIGDAVITTDVAGRVTFLNAVAQALTGCTQEEAIAQPLENVFNIINEDTRKRVDNPASRALREGAIVGLANHTLLIARDGTQIPIDDSAAPIRDAGGATIGAVLVFRDITERKRAEQALREHDRRKDEFLATLAHELRNPLAPLRNALQLARHAGSDPGGNPDGNAVRPGALLDMMDRQVEQMVRLVDDLLDLARVTQGKLRLHLQSTDLITVVNNALEISAPILQQAGHKVSVSLPDEPLYVDGDATRLSQVVCNLLNNAAKFSRAGGTLQLALTRQDRHIVLRVKDQGIGMPADKLEEIFEMFSQLDRSLERPTAGLGVGLPLARQIVQMHGGTIQALSAGPGCGSEFIVRLPPSDAAPVTTEPARVVVANPDHRNIKVLIADDNRDSADSMGMLLDAHGYEVHVVYDGLEAVEAANRRRPDVILLDIGMPRMNGYDAARSIRRQIWSARTVLIALTGWGQPEDRQRSAEAGFDRHLVKPVDLPALENAFRTVRDVAAP